MLLPADGPSGLHRYKLRVLFDAVEMRWDWPADVNYHEAQVCVCTSNVWGGTCVCIHLCVAGWASGAMCACTKQQVQTAPSYGLCAFGQPLTVLPISAAAAAAAPSLSYVQAYCAWKTAQDGQLIRYRVITEAEHQLIRNTRDRSDAYLLDSNSNGAAAAPAAAGNGVVVLSADKAAHKGSAAVKAVNISVSVGGAAAAAAPSTQNVDIAMVVSGQDAAKVRWCCGGLFA